MKPNFNINRNSGINPNEEDINFDASTATSLRHGVSDCIVRSGDQPNMYLLNISFQYSFTRGHILILSPKITYIWMDTLDHFVDK